MHTHIKQRSTAQAGLTQPHLMSDTPFERLPNLDALFTSLTHGKTPNFLDMMSAISEMVDFLTVCDTNSGPCLDCGKNVSQKICRFSV